MHVAKFITSLGQAQQALDVINWITPTPPWETVFQATLKGALTIQIILQEHS